VTATHGEGQEVLIIDGDKNVQRGLEQLLRAAGLTPTGLTDPARALDLSAEKFFSVAVVDADTPTTDEGVKIIGELRRRSPQTSLMLMVPRRSYELAVRAFRGGADDVVVKTPDQVEYLRSRVVALAAGKQREQDIMRLLEETRDVHEDLMKALLDTYRQLTEIQERRAEADGAAHDEATAVLLAEDDGWLETQLRPMLDARGGYVLRRTPTGGEALDLLGQERFHIALIKESLPDLPGSMVVRTVKAQAPDTIVLQFTPPVGKRPGSVNVMDTTRAIEFLPHFVDAAQLAERLGELRDAFHATARERRYLGAFRQQHFDLLKRYAELRAKLQKSASEREVTAVNRRAP
jgi:DNA-binding response OmpR family regulator